MANNPVISSHLANVEADAAAPEFNGGHLSIYTGSQPDNAGDPVTAQVLLCTLRFASPAVNGPAVDGLLTFAALAGVQAINQGVASWFRCLKSDGVTVLGDGSVGLENSGSDLELSSLNIDAGIEISIPTFTWLVRKK